MSSTHGISAYIKDGCRCDVCRSAWSEYRKQPERMEKRRETDAAWRKNNQDKRYVNNRPTRMRRFGLTVDQYEAILEKQSGVCALCSSPPKKRKLAVDHCHETGRIRGLLCSNCNTGLGKMGDNIAGLERAILYLSES